VLFYWQHAPTVVESLDSATDVKSGGKNAVVAANGGKVNQLVVSNGSKEALTGVGCFFVRVNTRGITSQNIANEVWTGFV
jgi:hypothetical protein